MISKNLREEVHNCIKCGICLTPCPVYKQSLVEVSSPRGKVQLIRNIMEGKLDLSENFVRILFTCLLCETCTVNCPSGLKVDQLMKAMRVEVIEKFGLPGKKKFLFELLTGKRMLPFYLFWGRVLRNSLLPLIPVKGKVGTIPYKKLPRLNRLSFLKSVPEVIPVPRTPRAGALFHRMRHQLPGWNRGTGNRGCIGPFGG